MNSLYLATPHGIPAFCAFGILWILGHKKYPENTCTMRLHSWPAVNYEGCSGGGGVAGAGLRSVGATGCAAYLHPVHTGFHLQLLHRLPGLGDARGAVVGHTLLHPAAPEITRVKRLGALLS